MTRDQFAKLFEEYEHEAKRVLMDRFGGNETVVDEAVQNAAVYVLENIGRFKQLTKSYFIQLASSRAKNELRGEKRRQNRTTAVGNAYDLAVVEIMARDAEIGRKYTPGDDDAMEHWTVPYAGEEAA